MSDSKKQADLAGPGIGNYEELERLLPQNYQSVLTPIQTQRAISLAKSQFEQELCQALNLDMVTVPLIVEKDSGFNDMLDRDGSRTPVDFLCGLGLESRIQAQVVQAATKWKRVALGQFGMEAGEGLCTDMRAIRKDYFLDHDHSSYVDQWDWEQSITREQRTLGYLTEVVKKIWVAFESTEELLYQRFPALLDNDYQKMPNELVFLHAEELLERYPDLPRKQRETAILQEHPALFIYGIGYPLEDGYPHELRAADYDDWITPTQSLAGKPMHGLNGDILVWNSVTQRRHELSSMGVRVDAESLKQQMKMAGLEEELVQPYHQAILNHEIPLSIGGGIGQSRLYMLLLQKAHLGEVSVSVWPRELKEICKKKNIHLLY